MHALRVVLRQAFGRAAAMRNTKTLKTQDVHGLKGIPQSCKS